MIGHVPVVPMTRRSNHHEPGLIQMGQAPLVGNKDVNVGLELGGADAQLVGGLVQAVPQAVERHQRETGGVEKGHHADQADGQLDGLDRVIYSHGKIISDGEERNIEFIQFTDEFHVEKEAGVAGMTGHLMRNGGVKARTIAVKVRDSSFHTVSRQRTLPEPTDQTEVVFAAARELDPERARDRSGGAVAVVAGGRGPVCSQRCERLRSTNREAENNDAHQDKDRQAHGR